MHLGSDTGQVVLTFLQSVVCQPSSSWHFGAVSCLRRYASSAALLWESQILNCRDVEQAVNSLSAPPGPFNLGNTAYLSQESTQDRQALYAQLVNGYKWTDKVCNFGIGSVFWQLFVATFASLYHNINIALLDNCLIFFLWVGVVRGRYTWCLSYIYQSVV